MFVCLCKAITDRQIREARDQGYTTVEALGRHLGVATCCGRCRQAAIQVLETTPIDSNLFYAAT